MEETCFLYPIFKMIKIVTSHKSYGVSNHGNLIFYFTAYSNEQHDNKDNIIALHYGVFVRRIHQWFSVKEWCFRKRFHVMTSS